MMESTGLSRANVTRGVALYRSLAMAAAALTLVPLAFADVHYKVSVLPDAGMLHISMHLTGTNRGSQFQMPNWAPGAYFLNENFKAVKNLKALDADGNPLDIAQEIVSIKKTYRDGLADKVFEIPVCTWKVKPTKSLTVEYDIAQKPVDGAVHWGGPTTYLYETGHRLEKCVLELQLPQGWTPYLGLTETKPGSNVFTAKTYDVLADNPVSTGELTVDHYESRGKTHWIVMRGAARTKVDRVNLLNACKFVSDTETDFFGASAPYDKYVWHFAVMDSPDGAGGLEHLSSTQISLAAGVGPRAKSVLAHEFFHLWNVKRIRSKPLGPFDYTKLPETGALWWLEGVTDYYAFTLPHRYGGNDDASYFSTIASNLQIIRNNPAHKLVGPNEASLRVDEANGGRGNSNGYLMSYYNLGWLAGLCLDIEIRSATNGKKSLDDVEHALWELCRNDKPGFEEDEIRRQTIRMGGPEMGAVYDRIVMKADGMAMEDTLAKVGLKVVVKPEQYVDLGIGFGGFPGATALVVNAVRASAEGKVQVGDKILAVNGKALAGDNVRAMAADMTKVTKDVLAGTPIKLTIMRGDAKMDVEISPATLTRDIYSIAPESTATEGQLKLRQAWLAQKKARN